MAKTGSTKSKPRTAPPRKAPSSPAAKKPTAKKPTAPTRKPAAPKTSATAAKKDTVSLSSEAKQSKGTNGDDKLSPTGNMPNLIETYGGNDQVWMRGEGTSKVNTGEGNDLIGVDGNMYGGGTHNTQIDGGEGRDAVFAGSDSRNRNFTVTDEQGRRVAQNGEGGGDNIQIKNVESVHASAYHSGTKGDDQIVSDLKTGDSDVRVNEKHTVFGGEGDDQITVRTGDNGGGEARIWGGEGNNQVRFEGGAGSDRVSYTSERNERTPGTEGADQVRLDGGEGFDQASITSNNYRVTGPDGKVISQMGEGADQFMIENFERLTIHNGQGEKGFQSFDL